MPPDYELHKQQGNNGGYWDTNTFTQGSQTPLNDKSWFFPHILKIAVVFAFHKQAVQTVSTEHYRYTLFCNDPDFSLS